MPIKKILKKPAKKIVAKKPVFKKSSIKAVAIKKPKQIGKILHYFNNVKVAVIKFKESVKTGDTVKIMGGEAVDFKQKIVSMQIDHKKVATAKKGQEVGVKVKEKVREGYKVFKV